MPNVRHEPRRRQIGPVEVRTERSVNAELPGRAIFNQKFIGHFKVLQDETSFVRFGIIPASTSLQVWANCLPYSPERFKSEHRDIVIHVPGDMAMMHGVHHLITEQPDVPIGQNWLRVTVGYRRIDGEWKLVHDYIFTPYNPMTSQAWMIRDPDTVDIPDRSPRA